MHRRQLLEGTVCAVPLTALTLAGLLPRPSRAAWPDDAFHGKDLAAVQADLFDDVTPEDTDAVTIAAPDIAENGRVVPVEIGIDLPSPQTMTLFSDGNPYPLLARARFTPDVEPRLSVRVKMGESANLIALVEADGKLYRATRAVKVTSGGCGG